MMLDVAIRQKLTEVFSALTEPLTFVVAPSKHERQADLLSLAQELASTSTLLDVVVDGDESAGVLLSLRRKGALLPARFRGVPGGHELTSLVLAVLHANGLGKLPDEGIRLRMVNLKGPASLRTYVSLSCENCPDVVQALGLISLLNTTISHEMVDGALVPEEVNALGLQGVPAVFLNDELIHVGKSSLAELLNILEEKLGRREDAAASTTALVKHYDVVVIGGGPAGASAAIYTARKGLRTAIVTENVGGQLNETLGIENMIGTKRTEGARLAADLAAHVGAYGIDVLEHRHVVQITQGPTKVLEIRGGERIESSILIVATGAKWRELGVPGEKDYLGKGVAFCPHCDGPFYVNKRIAVVGGGNSGVEAAIDLSGIAAHVTLVEYADALKADDVLVQKLRKLPNVAIVLSAKTTGVLGDGNKVHTLTYEDRTSNSARELALDGVFVQIGLSPNSAMVKGIVETNRYGEIIVDDRGRTSAPGIYAAGDVTTTPYKQIVIAMGDGAKVALAAFEDRMKAA